MKRLKSGFTKQESIHSAESVRFMDSEIRPPAEVLKILKEKLEIVPDKKLDSFYTEPNNSSANREEEFVRKKVMDYLDTGVVEEVVTPPRYCNPLSVVSKIIYKTGECKKRLVLDVSRNLNDKVKKWPGRPDDLSAAEQFFEEGMYGCVLDLKSMFHHCKLRDQTAELFGFRLRNPAGGSTFYRYKALPFGFRNSGAIMQMLTDPLIRYLRTAGVVITLYIDDFLVIEKSKESLEKKVELVITVFELAGWIFEKEKTVRIPSQRVEYLGFIIDFEKMTYSIDEDKRKHVIGLIKDVLEAEKKAGKVTTKEVAECLGKVISLKRAIGPIIGMCLRHTQHRLGQAVFTGDLLNPDWGGSMSFDKDCIRELLMALRLVESVKDRRIPPVGKQHIFTLGEEVYKFEQDLKYKDKDFEVLVSDASDSCAFVYEAQRFDIVEEFKFDTGEKMRGSGRRELLAIHNTLIHKAGFFKNSRKNIFWITDSKNVYFWMSKGSRHAEVQKELLSIKTKELDLGIEIIPIWQPRESLQIVWADVGSKLAKSTDEWCISMKDFKRVTRGLGVTPTVDAFASRLTARLPIFFSKCPQMNTSGIDFFSQDLQSDQVYWCTPPVSIVVKTIRHILSWDTQVKAVVNVPEWRSAAFWPFIVQKSRFAQFVKAVWFYRPSFTAFNDSPNSFSGRAKFRMIALVIDNMSNENVVSY